MAYGSTDFASSTAPADVVRRQYLASAAGDLEALRATLAPDVEWTVEPSAFVSKGRNTPYAGQTLRGRAEVTVVDGRIIHRRTG